eukprot:CAMPEP_0172681082 /NCGR_PEP_ID=MMETSP1074-20121228/17214_1 /TAXON_ID=2916 /ORGANISM="Ceratium fusus, Strain PA161109" /LENGTH=265 /DNA_ID=CAMNT_0013499531 /DNA_START=16 /DNA_END=810 /DNA_ORIENTATION=-
MAAAATLSTENIRLSDGTTMDITKVPNVDDETWSQVKDYLVTNPDTAKTIQGFGRNPDAMRGWLQTQAIVEHYQRKLEANDSTTTERMKELEKDSELAPIFEDIKKNGLEALMKHCQDEDIMLKFSRKMGGLPSELMPKFKQIEEAPMTLHEAAKNGDLKEVQQFLERGRPLDVQDVKGITALGYAIGSNKIAVVKLLLDSRANPFAVDSVGNSGLHYAAGYGRKELLEYLLKTGCGPQQQNSQGQTPLAVATMNKQEACIGILR